ncbi:MAG: hypothetical protein ACR2HF_02425 [Methylococcaceae bacterium]
MNQVSETVTLFFAAVLIATMGFEINRRRKKLREIYDVLDDKSRHVVLELEQMVEQGVLTPYAEDILA